MCGGCVKGTVRLFLQAVTLIHALLGGVVIVFGVVMLTEQPSKGFSFPHGVLVLGGFLAIVGIMGLYSVSARKRCCQCFFTLLMGLLGLINLALVVMLFIPDLKAEIFKFVTENDGTCEGVNSDDKVECEKIGNDHDTCTTNAKCKWGGGTSGDVEKAKDWIQHNTVIFQAVLGGVCALEIMVVALTCWYRGKAKARGESWADMDRMLMGPQPGAQPGANPQAVYNYQPGNVNYQPQQNYSGSQAPYQPVYNGNSKAKQSRDRMRDKYGGHFSGV